MTRIGVACCLVIGLTGLPAAAQVLPDIRGIDFGAGPYTYQGIPVFGGVVVTPNGNTPAEDNPTRDPGVFNGIVPNTFRVVADPAAPTDPTRIRIQTRFATGDDAISANPPLATSTGAGVLYWNLDGTYNRATGAISVSQSQIGTFFVYDEGPGVDPLGLPIGNRETVLKLVNPSYSLHAVLSVLTGGGLSITGTDPMVAPGGPSTNISFTNATLGDTQVIFTPAGSLDPFDPQAVAFPVVPGTEYGGFYNWSVTPVPEPGSLALMGLAVAGLLTRLRARDCDGRRGGRRKHPVYPRSSRLSWWLLPHPRGRSRRCPPISHRILRYNAVIVRIDGRSGDAIVRPGHSLHEPGG